RGDPAQRPGPVGVRAGDRGRGDVVKMGVDDEAEPPQQQSNVGALRAVVGVEFVQHYVLQSRVGQAQDVGVLVAQVWLVDHFVVGQQQVGGSSRMVARSVIRPASLTVVRPV